MGFGIANVTAITYENLSEMVNVTSFPEFAININHDVYNGWLYFFLLWIIGIIVFYKLQTKQDQPLINAMYTGTLLTFIALFLRAIEMVQNGIVRGLLSDFQMWIFPLLTVLLAGIIWATKEKT